MSGFIIIIRKVIPNMANSATGFVGVPKREPCRKCGNPVFFAERISFEQKLYHRSCLKCARCNAQLTLGSFYETETDGEYCCETCPDEEIQLSQRRRSSAGGSADSTPAAVVTNGSRSEGARVNRSSSKLLDRISFFESAPLSDEEKTSNLVRRAKISSFLKDTLESSGDGLENGHSIEVNETSKLAEPIESEEDSSSDDEPPEPPATAPPELTVSKELELAEPITKEEEALKESTETPEPVAIEESVEVKPEITVNTNGETEESHKDLEPSRRSSSTSEQVEVVAEVQQEEKEVEKAEDDQVTDVIDPVVDVEPAQVEEVKASEVSDETVAGKSAEEVPEVVETVEEQPTISVSEKVPKHDTEVRSDVPVAPVPTTAVTEPEDQKQDVDSTKTKELYPTDLNPFGEDSEGEQQTTSITSIKPVPSTRRVSTNPFGSDEEEETSLPVAVKPPRPPPPKLKTAVPANPFDDEDDEPEREIVPVIVKPSPRRTPVPTPRKQHNHNDSISSMETSLMSSQFGGSSISLASSMESGPSNATISRRKKSRAPDIPLAASALAKVSTENLAGSTSTTPRKKRLAPPPPPPPAISSTPKQPDSKSTQRLIALDASLINNDEDDIPQTEPLGKPPASDDSVVYRRTIVPLKVDDDSLESGTTPAVTSERQWEKMKDNKEAQNRNRQSQTSPTSSQNNDSYNSFISNKSQQGKWKRRKGPAPALPVPLPERKAIKMLPLKEIRQEMDIIETQQQGLEKQGVILEQMIRERCEGVGPEMDITGIQTNSKEVEDLIMQLFELVNEKNELFRRQAELMYLRRQHRLEQEQADLEYEIRLLMAQPERNKTDSDKEKEEALIARLVEIVQMRNEVVDCLEMDRLREAEEDMSIKQSIEERAANQQRHGKKDSDTEKSATGDSTMKLSKKEKKKLKEAKKLVKSKKIDSEKDADDTESSTKEKKKKKKFFADFLHHK
ncbi:MICAL-like protein 1 isoform X3 [Culex pipiens pallens]|uniref:MICAL-like protein 1 isoform X3 n=1 Tax=Culex pipiens pallens TaxID=42434 RepID=UPI00195360ED|nr:MICAL-like protein 1 isoform X3 [Culex pipiens pallens]